MVAGTVPWLWMILAPDPSGTRRVSPVPLRDLLTLAPGDPVVQIDGNLLVFAVAGFLLRVAWPVGTGTVLVVAAGASTVVESPQYLLDRGRVSSVDELFNALGAGPAAALSRPLWRRSRPVSEEMATT